MQTATEINIFTYAHQSEDKLKFACLAAELTQIELNIEGGQVEIRLHGVQGKGSIHIKNGIMKVFQVHAGLGSSVTPDLQKKVMDAEIRIAC